jgi:Putative Zn-dependent protease, contains TPR repeats
MRKSHSQIFVAFLILTFGASTASAQIGDALRRAQNNAQKAKKAADIYTAWTEEQEQAIGEASAARLIHIFGTYENAEMVKYVNLVGNTVARQGSRTVPYRFAVLDTEVITALSLPGGYIFITRGALANLHNEAELAGTLAHEIAHVDRRHLEKEIRSKKTSQFAKEETVTRVPQGAELVNLAGDVVKNALTLQVSRDKESEADKVGMEFAAKAGYDPAGLRNFLQTLAEAPSTDQSRRQLSLWGSTHPPFSARVSELNSLLASYPAGGQQLQERYSWYVNPVAFSKSSSAGATSGGSAELDGVVSQGVVVLTGGKLAEGTRVKVRIQH